MIAPQRIRAGTRTAPSRSRLLRLRLVERRSQPARQGQRVIRGPEVHEEEPRALPEHVGVQGGDLDPAAGEGVHDRFDFPVDECVVTGDGGLSAGGFGAVDIGLRHPGMFRTLESWGGYFRPFLDGPFAHATQADLRAHTPTLLVSREASQLRRVGTRFFLSTGRSGHGDVKARWTFEFAGELARLRLAHKLWVLPDAKRSHLFREQLPAAIDYASPAT